MDMSVNQKLPVAWQKLTLKGLMGGLWWTREEVISDGYNIYVYISINNIIYFCGHLSLSHYCSHSFI